MIRGFTSSRRDDVTYGAMASIKSDVGKIGLMRRTLKDNGSPVNHLSLDLPRDATADLLDYYDQRRYADRLRAM